MCVTNLNCDISSWTKIFKGKSLPNGGDLPLNIVIVGAIGADDNYI
jgi:hypothetical protein